MQGYRQGFTPLLTDSAYKNIRVTVNLTFLVLGAYVSDWRETLMTFLGNEHFIQCLMLLGLCKSDINSTIMALSTLLITLLLVKNLNSSQNRCEMWVRRFERRKR